MSEKYKPRAVEVTVHRLIEGDHPIAGRAYASFLARLLRLLDSRYGISKTRRNSRRNKTQVMTHAIATVIKANPEWTYEQVASAVGAHPNTVRSIDHRVREKYNLPPKKPGRKPREEQHGQTG